MRYLHETILIIPYDDKMARDLLQSIRAKRIYCELLSPRRFMEDPRALEGRIHGIIVAGSYNGSMVDPFTVKLSMSEIPFTISTGYRGDDEHLDLFLYYQCRCSKDWTPESYIQESLEAIRNRVGQKSLVLGLSGGVDSSVAAFLVHQAVGDQLTCIFVDHGLMRKGEADLVRAMFSDRYRIPMVFVDAADRFLKALSGVKDPEAKRKIIGREFIRVFEEEAAKIQADFLVQGTIYPDIIESGADGQLVKSHHNVGGLPETVNFEGILEPLSPLFKEEVREVGRLLGLPGEMVDRQPFPGPGLAIRCLGEVTEEKLAILREADAIFREEVESQGYKDQASQYFAVMTGLQSVGVKGGARTYDYTIALRAVNTEDFMAARPVEFSWDFLQELTRRITQEVPRVSRVVYELTGKPPATIEWE